MKRIPNIAVLGHGFELVRATEQASAFDIRVTEDLTVTRVPTVTKLGIKTAIDECQLALMAPRSGLGSKGLRVCNTVGIIDTDYRGEWMATLVLEPWSTVEAMEFKRGDRILQVAFLDTTDEVEYVPEDELGETTRGEGGFGHSGVK